MVLRSPRFEAEPFDKLATQTRDHAVPSPILYPEPKDHLTMKILAFALGKLNTICCYFGTETRKSEFINASTERNYLTTVLKKYPASRKPEARQGGFMTCALISNLKILVVQRQTENGSRRCTQIRPHDRVQ
ncbi:MAG TPA: hypothetical protein VM260_16745 [Pirellula sp.]|nr:hypothetical protein [Pirellula sp.]